MTTLIIVLSFLGVFCITFCSGSYAIAFSDNVAVAHFKDFPGNEFTFEAWVSVSDVCHPTGTILSFAASQDYSGSFSLQAQMNAFVISNPYRVLACRGYENIYGSDGCIDNVWGYSYSYNGDDYHDQSTSNLYSADGSWHHLAVTYQHNYQNKTDHYKILIDGLIAQVASVDAENFIFWKNGTLVLGSDQDCLGGCTSEQQSFHGKMDEVKIWKRVLSEREILQNMRLQIDPDNAKLTKDLVAYWSFEEIVEGNIAADLSGNGHNLTLYQLPQSRQVTLPNNFKTTSLEFKNSWAMKSNISNMPDGDFTVEFWAITPSLQSVTQQYHQPGIFSFASVDPGNGNVDDDKWLQDANFLFDAISVSKHNSDYWSAKVGLNSSGTVSTLGAISLHVNNFEIIFLANWTDQLWHHIAVTWVKSSGLSRLYFDRQELSPYAIIPPVVAAPLEAAVSLDPDVEQDGDYYDYGFYDYFDDYYYDYDYYDDYYDDQTETYSIVQTSYNSVDLSRKHAGSFYTLHDIISEYNSSSGGDYLYPYGGIDPTKGTNRSSYGSLVFGQLQRNYGGGFTQRLSYTGALGVVRVWNKALDLDEINRNMYIEQPADKRGLVVMYNMQVAKGGVIKDLQGGLNDLRIGAPGPILRTSSAPLTTADGQLLHPPENPKGGYALRLHDKVTVLRPQINFPTEALTVELWMLSTDTCRKGTPFSYAVGSFENADYYYYNYYDDSYVDSYQGSYKGSDAFLITDYNGWKVRVMDDRSEESYLVGTSATDGHWHHIAVTWRSQTGATAVYQDGSLLYRTKRAKNQKIITNGTLVIGRDQDCQGGCWYNDDAAGDRQTFFGLIDEVRIWSRVLSPQEIDYNFRRDGYRLQSLREGALSFNDKDLVAQWSFDEGEGYVVKDTSGNKNHLYISGQPTWEPVVIESSCGNGRLEELESCDDGNRVSGDGCSAQCRIEGGWTCTPESPSVCTYLSFVKLKTSKNSQGRKSVSNIGVIVGVVITMVLVLVLLIGVVLKRKRIYEQFPWIEDKVERMFSRSRGVFNRSKMSLPYTEIGFENGSGDMQTTNTNGGVVPLQQYSPPTVLSTEAQSQQQSTYTPLTLDT